MSLRDFVQAAMAAGTKASVDVLAPIRSVPLLDLVKEMQPELTSQLPKVAPTALFVLSAAAIHRVEPHLPSAQEVDVVVDFLVSKVGHFTTIDSAVEGLSRLVCWGLTNMPEVYCRGEVVTKVVGKVLARIQVQSMFGRSKIAAMDLVEAITNPNVIEVVAETCGRDFLSVFLTCVDGEREPELVLKMIQMTGRLVTAFPASHLNFFVEDFFVTISSYFPVLFNPPPHCPVTRQMLKDALHPLMLFPVFHEHCIPFLFAKLTSPAASAKHDSLALLRTLFTPPSEGNAPYPPSLLQPHISDTLALLRGEVVKMVQLTSVMGGDNAVQAVLRSTLDVVTRIGEVLGEGYGAEDILSMADHSLLSPVMSLVDSGSDSRAYAVLLHALTKKSPAVCGNVCAYLMPMLGWKLAELHEKVLELSPLEVRKVSSSVTIVGALLSSVEMLKNGTSSSSAGGVVTTLRGLKPESVEDIIPLVCSILNGDCPSSALHLTSLCADVIATYIAIIDLLEAGKSSSGSAEAEESTSSTEATKEKLVRMLATRVFTYEREAGDDEVPTSIAKAIGNVSRVEGSVVTRSLLLASSGEGNDTSFIMTHKHEISMPILFDALLALNRPDINSIICGLILFGVPGAVGLTTSATPMSTTASEGVLPAAADTHGSGSVVVSKYVTMCLDRIDTVVKRNSDDSKIVWLVELLQASPSILSTLDGCTEGPDLVTLILDVLVALGSPAALSVFDSIINASPANDSSSTLLWACAVAVAPISIFAAAPATTTNGWFARALALLPTATNNDPQTQVRELCALRAMASIANKSAEFAYAATTGVDIRVVAAVAKGRLARGAKEGVLACCESLLSWLHAPDAPRTLVDATSAFGGILANPQPSVSSPFWKQRTYCTLLESLLQYPAPSAAHATRSLYAVHALVASAGSSVVDPTAISNLVAIVHLGEGMSAAEADVQVANECRAATGLCLIQFMSLADKGLCADALRRAADLFLRNTTIAACARSAVAPPPRARSAAGIAPRVCVPLPLAVRLQAIEVHRSLYGYILGLDDDDEDDDEEVSSAPATKARRAEDSPASGVGKHLSASRGGGIQASPETLRGHMIAQKANVMEWLSKCQDDRKRLVRAAAGLARHEWYQLKAE